MPLYDLKLDDGRRVEIEGHNAVDAAERWVDLHRDDAVIATRAHVDKVGVFTWGGAEIEQ